MLPWLIHSEIKQSYSLSTNPKRPYQLASLAYEFVEQGFYAFTRFWENSMTD